MTAEGARFDEFLELPFMNCVEGQVFDVIFMDTDDPYFYGGGRPRRSREGGRDD